MSCSDLRPQTVEDERDLVNTVIEVSLEGNTVTCLEYRLPGERRATAYRKPRPLTR
jgi:hypothetical protein